MTPDEMMLRLTVIFFAMPIYGLWAFWLGVRQGRRWAVGKVAV
jgi:hypothetical protein